MSIYLCAVYEDYTNCLDILLVGPTAMTVKMEIAPEQKEFNVKTKR